MDPCSAIADSEWVTFLQWCLPRLGLRWEGFRKVRRQVTRRIRTRMDEMGDPGLACYRDRLLKDRSEWAVLDRLCRVTISRFFRDRGVFLSLVRHVLPRLALRAEDQSDGWLRCLSVGCASGEEVYSVRLAWDRSVKARHANCTLEILGMDVDEQLLERAREARYPESSLANLPEEWRTSFHTEGKDQVLRDEHRHDVQFVAGDIRNTLPPGRFSLILCRNLVFTYFAADTQRAILHRLVDAIEPGGFLVTGLHETLPRGVPGLRPGVLAGIHERISTRTRAIFPEATLRPWYGA